MDIFQKGLIINNLKIRLLLLIIFFALSIYSCDKKSRISGQFKEFHPVIITFSGPDVDEYTNPNPFLDYKMTVEFIHSKSGAKYNVPGYYAADGNAANTGANSGNKWRVKFCPEKDGEWRYTVSFLQGQNVAVASSEKGKPHSFHGQTGSFNIQEVKPRVRNFRNKGILRYTKAGYLRFSDSNKYFIKVGPNSPENFLAYKGFDGTYYGGDRIQREGESAPNPKLHDYDIHKKDWQNGDPTWKKAQSQGIIGAINYIADKGMNTAYFLTLNIEGDGEDVWPYNRKNERYRFDCSKLAQWDIVFSYMNERGILPHLVLQETENECLLDAGYLGHQRKLYLRELVARFSHHPGLMWNLGEEHGPVEWSPYGQTAEDTKAMAKYLNQIDPYNHPIVIHTHSTNPDRTRLLKPYLGFSDIDGISFQCHDPQVVHSEIKHWKKLSKDSLRNWLVSMDEIGPYQKGLVPDSINPTHDTLRTQVLWGSLMAGAAGVEWYFGYKYPANDLDSENWKLRKNMWEQTAIAKDFFQQYLPFWDMQLADHLISNDEAYCFAKPDSIYTVYLPKGGTTNLKISDNNSFQIKWFNPRQGGSLQDGTKNRFIGPTDYSIGFPPRDRNQDWVVLIKNIP